MTEGGVLVPKKLKEVSELWSGEVNPTLHEVIPALSDLHGNLTSFTKGRYSKGKEWITCSMYAGQNLGQLI